MEQKAEDGKDIQIYVFDAPVTCELDGAVDSFLLGLVQPSDLV